MRSPAEIARLEDLRYAAELGRIASCILRAGESGYPGAVALAERTKSPERVIAILKAVAAGGSMSNWGSPLRELSQISEGFLSYLRGPSLFDNIAVDAIKVPANLAATVISGGSASVVDEGAPAPALKLSFTTSIQSPRKAQGIVVVSNDLIKLGGSLLDVTLNRELRNVIARTVNTDFVAGIIPAGSPDPAVSSSGNDAEDAHNDILALMAALTTDAFSKVHLALGPGLAKRIIAMHMGGVRSFPDMTLSGGFICSLPTTVTPAVPDDEVFAIDASRFAVDPGIISVDRSEQATIEVDDEPDAPPTAATIVRNLWQHSETALKVERLYAFRQLSAGAVARLVSVEWGQ